MATNVLALLDQAAPRATITNRPANAIDCALAEFGCTGWTRPEFAVLRVGTTLIGLCPRREAHAAIAKGNTDAATIVGRLAGLFRQTNPSYVVGSKAKTKVLNVRATAS